ncbi:hypothetical protein RHE_CH02523 [Rhizobium etli CFN 42]|uniref:Uncharacterized protein n=2 Tax=Rhizobium etli TaxID=29449 RepID=Q2K788_RHIEC|nr:hypothetical protein RHE_CH02523 [Rhizobium etli CFN 42]ARQ10600.1 hypothetical protein NXC12_CH02589 [Rhizobium etli]
MRRILLTLILCIVPTSISFASGQAVFHTASFGDGGSVSLSIAEGRPSRYSAFDFDAIITLSEADRGGPSSIATADGMKQVCAALRPRW